MTDISVCLATKLSSVSPWRTGGVVCGYAVAHTFEGARQVVVDCRRAGYKLFWLGAGTRCVFRDGPMSGVVARLGVDFMKVTRQETLWTAGAAAPVAGLVGHSISTGHTGLERWANSGGSFGASLLLDDGWDDVIESVSVLFRGKVHKWSLAAVQKRKPLVLSAEFRLVEGSVPRILEAVRRVRKTRRPAPPCACLASTTKKSEVRQVLQSVSLPMVRLRKMMIPEVAPEVLVNLGGGTAADFALLMKSAQDRVYRARGIQLQKVIRLVGSPVDRL